jgi:hypothetical protein
MLLMDQKGKFEMPVYHLTSRTVARSVQFCAIIIISMRIT